MPAVTQGMDFASALLAKLATIVRQVRIKKQVLQNSTERKEKKRKTHGIHQYVLPNFVQHVNLVFGAKAALEGVSVRITLWAVTRSEVVVCVKQATPETTVKRVSLEFVDNVRVSKHLVNAATMGLIVVTSSLI